MSVPQFALGTLRRASHNRRQWGELHSDSLPLSIWHEILREQVDKLYADIDNGVSNEELEQRIFKNSAVLFEMYKLILKRGEAIAQHNGEAAEVLPAGDGVQARED